MSVRWIVVLLAAVAALVMTMLMIHWPSFGSQPGLQTATAAGLLILVAVAAVAIEWWVRAPLVRLASAMARTREKDYGPVPPGGGPVEVAACAENLDHLRGALRAAVAERQRLLEDRRTVEQRLRESEQRYALAVSGANDGMFEWDLRTGHAYFSPRWKAMLGYRDEEVGEDVEDWRSRIHPDDADDAEQRLQAHIEGRSDRFETEYRLRARDGSYRWVLARAQAIRHASSVPYRLVGLHTDISARRHIQELVLELADGLATARGEEYFRSLVRNFARVTGARDAFLCEALGAPVRRVRTLAYWSRGMFRDNVEFDLTGTTCEEVITSRRTLYCPRNLGDRWPLEKNVYGRESYLGIPIFDSAGTLIGHIACMHDRPMVETLPHQAIVKLFAVCAGTEMERRMLAARRCG